MNLHRTDKEPQWGATPPEERNVWQKLAAKTNSIVTPANAVSVIGLGLVASGLKDIARGNRARGITKVGAGRMLDVVDGFTAEKTKTKSPTGEAVDVIVDKAEAAITVPVLVKADILPKAVAGRFLTQHAANIVFTAIAKRRGAEIHTSQEGKWNTAGQWGAIGLYGLASVARQKQANNIGWGLEVAAQVTVAATTYLGAKAVLGYAHDAFQPVPEGVAARLSLVPDVPHSAEPASSQLDLES